MLKNRESQRVPNVTFPARVGNDWQKLTTDDLFKNKTVVVFCCPVRLRPLARPPTCHTTTN